MLDVRLLGQYDLRYDREPFEFSSRPAQSLFAFLILNAGIAHRRERLAGLLWPVSTESNARNNLRQALWRIRKTLGEHTVEENVYLQANHFSITFNLDASYRFDVKRLEDKLSGRASSEDLIAALEEYAGDLLPGFYEDWVTLERERLRAEYERKLHRLLEVLMQEARWEELLEWGERWIVLGGSPEPAYRAIMVGHYGLGDSANAQHAYDRCVESLRTGLSIEPTEETVSLHERIKNREPLLDIIPVVNRAPDRVRELRVRDAAPQKAPDEVDIPSTAIEVEPSFVGRESELEQLNRALVEVNHGHGQIAVITGNTGTGKTTLLGAFAHRSTTKFKDIVVASGNCNSLTGIGDPYLPFRKILRMLCGDVGGEMDGGRSFIEQTERLKAMAPLTFSTILEYGPDLIDGLVPGHVLFTLGQSHADCSPVQLRLIEQIVDQNALRRDDPKLRQVDIFGQYAAVLNHLASVHPLAIFIDDLQWADIGTLNLLFYLGRQLNENRILLICASRPIELQDDSGDTRLPLGSMLQEFKRLYGEITIDLNETCEKDGRDFIEAFIDTEPNQLGAPFRDELYHHTGGNPLFIVELLRAMEKRGDIETDEEGNWVAPSSLDWSILPGKLEGVIEDRIMRLDPELLEVITLGSVEGEEFTAEVISKVLQRDNREIVGCLSGKLDKIHKLVSAQQVSWIGDSRLSTYRFRHILIQKHLYGRLDSIEKVHLHEEVGLALETLHSGRTDEIAIQLERHFREARIPEKAVEYGLLAAEEARRLSANEEAVQHLRGALELLQTTPESSSRSIRELQVYSSLGVALIATKGYGAREVEETFSQALELCESFGDDPQLFMILYGLRMYTTVRGRHKTAQELGERLLVMAQVAEDPDFLLEAHQAVGASAFYLGDLESARAHLEAALELYDIERHIVHTSLYGQDPAVACLSYLPLIIWCQGFPEQAIEKSHEALRLANQVAHPFSMVIALCFSSFLFCLMKGYPEAMNLADEAIQLSAKHGFPLWKAMGDILAGAAEAHTSYSSGIEQIEDGLRDWKRMGSYLGYPHFQALLGEASLEAGDIEIGLTSVKRALDTALESGDRLVEAELLRLQGEFKLLEGEFNIAERLFLEAFEVASSQKALTFELRAAMSMHRLGLQRGVQHKTRRTLERVFKRFSEGFDSLDLIEASELLQMN
jgi:predicted ATPase/DNA-binding SARP family transcriptional activator